MQKAVQSGLPFVVQKMKIWRFIMADERTEKTAGNAERPCSRRCSRNDKRFLRRSHRYHRWWCHRRVRKQQKLPNPNEKSSYRRSRKSIWSNCIKWHKQDKQNDQSGFQQRTWLVVFSFYTIKEAKSASVPNTPLNFPLKIPQK